MTNNTKIIEAVMEAIDEFNGQLPKEQKLNKAADAALFGSGGSLDSLGLVSLVTIVEQKIEEKFGITATLLEDVDLLENDNPFRTFNSLADYVASVLEKKRIE